MLSSCHIFTVLRGGCWRGFSVLISVILPTSLSLDVVLSHSWILWGCVPKHSQRIYYLRWKATGREALSSRARGINIKPSFHQRGLLVETQAELYGSVSAAVGNAAWCVSQRRGNKSRQHTDGAAGPPACDRGWRENRGKKKLGSMFLKFHVMSCSVRGFMPAHRLALGFSLFQLERVRVLIHSCFCCLRPVCRTVILL